MSAIDRTCAGCGASSLTVLVVVEYSPGDTDRFCRECMRVEPGRLLKGRETKKNSAAPGVESMVE